ncbi:hypothetical protein FAES_1025 [Fibrella aestuarina BUZ 2]|uniref:Lipoprotein n=1 Tax=Fibrella aestuarina BUZ 2 TaxID=1166018 RepID=I0K4I3_9BACT|nr:hypothetical protein [Fibrella aestuarina]CCG99036.1 hypothetical protein FAES_1025 [Fibrella aestuarina BUZ 2]
MRKQLIQQLALVCTLGVAVAACYVEPDYSDTPEISVVGPPIRYELEAGTGVGASKRDSIVLSIRFQDGTGDLGENTLDTARIRSLFGKETWGNYELRTFYLLDGKFVEQPASVNQKLYFPRMTRDGQRGAIEGNLDFSQNFPYVRPFRMVPAKFQIRIRDRGLRASNVVETDTINVPVSAR